MKEFFSFALVLKFLNFTKPFEVHINVSDFLIEAIFMQDGHPIAFENKKIYGTQLWWPIHEKSCMPWCVASRLNNTTLGHIRLTNS